MFDHQEELLVSSACENLADILFFLSGSLCVWYDTIVHDEHELFLPREEVWNHQLQVWIAVYTVTVIINCFFKLWSSYLLARLFRCVCNRRDRTKDRNRDGKAGGHRERRSRKPAAEKGDANSSKKPEETEPAMESSPTEDSQLPVDSRGPTIPRNTGQRYSALLSPQGAEPKHHITFSSHT